MDPEKCCESGCTPCERDPVGSEPRDLCNYIDGEFVCHSNDDWLNVLKPATGERFARVPLDTSGCRTSGFGGEKGSASMGWP